MAHILFRMHRSMRMTMCRIRMHLPRTSLLLVVLVSMSQPACGGCGSSMDAGVDGSTTDGAVDGSTTDGAVDGSTTDGAVDGSNRDGSLDGAAFDGGSYCYNIERVACSCMAIGDGGVMRSCFCDGGAGLRVTLACAIGGDCVIFSNTCIEEPYHNCTVPTSGVKVECETFCQGPARDDSVCQDVLGDAGAADAGGA